MKSVRHLHFLALAFLALTASAFAQEQNAREQFKNAVAAYQKTASGENALAVIKLYKQIEPPPAVPEEAREPFVMGATILKKASSPADAGKAVDLFTQSLAIAPWFAEARYNRALARETAGQFGEAMDDLKLYLEFKLTDTERREAQDKIYSLKADAQLASAKKIEEDKVAAAKKAEKDKSSALIPGTSYLISADGSEVTDNKNGLIWRRYAEGMVSSNGTISGKAIELNYEEALQHAKSQARRTGKAWRVPEARELASLVDKSRQPTINPTAFPAQPSVDGSSAFRSVTRSVEYPAGSLIVRFSDGETVPNFDKYRFYLRLVREGQ